MVRAAYVVFVLAVSTVIGLSAQPPSETTVVLDRVGEYATRFIEQFSHVVAEEQYVQDSHPADTLDAVGTSLSGAPQHTELRSDFLFVRFDSSSDWLTFRDVYSVNGRPVRNRTDRLTQLFLTPTSNAVARARQISREGYRYNLGSLDRTVANPVLALGFLQQRYRNRFEFQLVGSDSLLGSETSVLKFKERVTPTILRTFSDHNVMTSGRVWIDTATGRIRQTELDTSVGDRILTVFGYDAQLKMDVPTEMRDITWFQHRPITGTAHYSQFRRFSVATDETFQPIDK